MTATVRSRAGAAGAGEAGAGATNSGLRRPATVGGRLAAGLRAAAGNRADAAALRKVRGQVALEPGERLLSAAPDPGYGLALVASDRALYHRAGDSEWTRLGWEQVASVIWDEEEGRLVVVTNSRQRVPVPVRGCGNVREVAAERITHTRLGSWRVPVTGNAERHVVVEARRKPASGELLWFVAGASGTDGASATDGTSGGASGADGTSGAGLKAGAGAGTSWAAGLKTGAGAGAGTSWAAGLKTGTGTGAGSADPGRYTDQLRAEITQAIARLGHDSGISAAQAGQRPASIMW